MDAAWIDLDGAANVRDLAGLPTSDGRTVRPGRLIRADNLQDLSEHDVHLLVDDVGVRAVADLRTGVEVASTGPGPLVDNPAVEVAHLSLFPEPASEAGVVDGDAPVVLPWQSRTVPTDGDRRGATWVYLHYLDDRADSVLDALRLVAHSPGATIVHCAAGKDRTGMIVALALAEVGVTREAIVTDYARSSERIDAVFDRLRASSTYAEDMESADSTRHAPRAETMERVLDALDDDFGGVPAWLRAHGWTDADAAALRRKLLD